MRNTYLLKLMLKAKQCLVLLIAVCCLLLLAGCKREAEKQVYTDRIGGYSFSYPRRWEVYSESGNACISIADVGGALPFAIVRFSAFENEDNVSAADYWNSGIDGYSSAYDSYRIIQDKRGPFEKDGLNSAYSAVVEVSMKGETKISGQPSKAGEAADYTIYQLVFEGEGRICVATYMSSKANFDNYSHVMNDIKDSFMFTVPNAEQQVEDKKLAEFNMPVPEGWKLDVSEAYYKISYGKATIVACVYSMEKTISPKQYWEETYRSSVKTSLPGFNEGKTIECKLDGIDAIDVYYTGKSVSGTIYNFRQCIAVKQSQAYIITLTADDTDYESAVNGYEAVIKEFSFK